MGEYLKSEMEKKILPHPTVGEIRGKGLMVGAELVKNKETKECFPLSDGYAKQVQDEALVNNNIIIKASQGCNKEQSSNEIVVPVGFWWVMGCPWV